MPRNPKCRRVCAEPLCQTFLPQSGGCEVLPLSVEQLEAMRLCDLEGLDQDSAALRMDVSRGTFQRILYAARKCVATALVDGKGLSIGGGHYEVAQHPCQCGIPCTQCRFQSQAKPTKGENHDG